MGGDLSPHDGHEETVNVVWLWGRDTIHESWHFLRPDLLAVDNLNPHLVLAFCSILRDYGGSMIIVYHKSKESTV